MPRLNIGGRPQASWQPLALHIGPATRRIEQMLKLHARLEREGFPGLAGEVAALYTDMNNAIRSVAINTAQVFEEEARSRLNATQLRDDSMRGSDKLVDLIKAEAWDPNQRFAFGWVSMGLLVELDRARNPNARTGKGKRPYWRAQEYGYEYTHPLTGFFVGAGGSPLYNPGQPPGVRTHPMFAVSRKGGTLPEVRPIAARHYLAHGREVALNEWHAGMSSVDRAIAARINGIVAQIAGIGGQPTRRSRRPRKR